MREPSSAPLMSARSRVAAHVSAESRAALAPGLSMTKFEDEVENQG
jgi:hypothetical protein